MDFGGQVPFVRPREAPFPSVQELCFAPTHAADIAQALHDCPNVTSLSLALSHFQWGSYGLLGTYDLSSNHLTDLLLYDVPLKHVRDALRFYYAVSPKRCFSVMFMELPRGTSGLPEVPSHWIDNSHTAQWVSILHENTTQPSGSSLRFSPKVLYRRVANVTRGALRRPRAQLGVANVQDPPPAAPTQGTPFQLFGDIFRDFDGPVTIDLSTAVGGMCSSETRIVLHATDPAGRTRVAGLCRSDGDDPILAAHANVWRVVRPRHLVCDVELLPLLGASLREASTARSIELRFTHYFPARRVSYGIPPPEPRFPNVRELRLNSRYADSESRTVLKVEHVAGFVRGLGAELPLEAITICMGLVVQDAGVLDELANSVVWHVDPGQEHLRESCYPFAHMGHYSAVSVWDEGE